jgi:glycosyltransferase involved in cell wall biosynthesis
MSDSAGKLLVIIPAYNEEESIVSTIQRLQECCPELDYIVVDDGSLDHTAEICREHGFPLLQLPVNLGLSGAFQAGVQYACKAGYDYVLQFDADGQHLPQYIPAMLQKAREGADVVIASRYLKEAENHERSARRVGGILLQGAIRLTTGVRLSDPTSGMRMYSKRLISYFAQTPNFDPEPDMIAYLLHCGYRVEEVPVQMAERLAGKSYLRFGRAAQYMTRMLLSILLIQWFRKNKG